MASGPEADALKDDMKQAADSQRMVASASDRLRNEKEAGVSLRGRPMLLPNCCQLPRLVQSSLQPLV